MLQLDRSKVNPILVPDESNWWESKAVFNCSVLNDGKTIHMLYRAIGEYIIMCQGLVTHQVTMVFHSLEKRK